MHCYCHITMAIHLSALW